MQPIMPVFFPKGSPHLPRPMSGAERQRRFRQRHPDYNRQYNAARRAERKAARAAHYAEREHAAMASPAASPAPAEAPAPAMTTAPPSVAPTPPRLMLPAPVRDPVMDAIDALAASLASRRARDPLSVPARATPPSHQSAST